MDGGQFRGQGKARIETSSANFASNWRKMFRRRRRRHDPMLALNMSVFNFDDGWSRTFNPFKVHERGI
jgi:hypothetical protein